MDVRPEPIDDETLAAWYAMVDDEAALMDADDWYREELANQQLHPHDRARLALPEAPASVNCHITLAGRHVQLTLRDVHEGRLLARLEAVLQRFPLVVQPTDTQTPATEGWCSTHGVQMCQNHKDGRTWYSHKTADGWCKGR